MAHFVGNGFQKGFFSGNYQGQDWYWLQTNTLTPCILDQKVALCPFGWHSGVNIASLCVCARACAHVHASFVSMKHAYTCIL